MTQKKNTEQQHIYYIPVCFFHSSICIFTVSSIGLFVLLYSQQDREKIAKYNLTIIGTNADANTNRNLNGTSQLIVNVLDVDDNAPVFDKSSYEAHVMENAKVNASVIKVHASDLDLVRIQFKWAFIFVFLWDWHSLMIINLLSS